MYSSEFDVDVTPPISESVSHCVLAWYPGHPVMVPVSSGFTSITFAVVSTVSGKKLTRDKVPDKYILIGWMKRDEKHTPSS